MKNQLRNISVIIWAVYFFVAMTGISLQSLYCHCADKAYVSLFEIKDNCGDHKKEKQLASCCQKVLKKTSCGHAAETEKNCCHSSSEYVKADIDILISPSVMQLPSVASAILSDNNFSSLEILKSNSTNPLPTYRPPPRRYGHSLRVYIQSYLC